MKVLGIGIDLVMNSRIERIINKNYAERFIKKFLHDQELKRYLEFEHQQAQIEFLASRWAVKEALSKAIGRKELIFNELNILKDRNGISFVIKVDLKYQSRAIKIRDFSSSYRLQNAMFRQLMKKITLLGPPSLSSYE